MKLTEKANLSPGLPGTGESIQETQPRRREAWKSLWPVLIDIWIFGVVAAFFVIRIVDSNLGQRVLAKILRGHFR